MPWTSCMIALLVGYEYALAAYCVFLNPSTLHIVLLREPGDFTYTFYWVSGSTLNNVLRYTCAPIVFFFSLDPTTLSFPSFIGRYTHIVLYSCGMYFHHGNTNPSHFDSSLMGVFLSHDLFRMLFWIWVGIDISSNCLLFFSLLKWDYE